MLNHNNLEEFQDPANYDLEETAPSAPRIAFYSELARALGGPVLEVACGTGIVTLPVAAQGLDVTGLDLVRPMLEQARRKAEQQGLAIRWAEGDARHFDLGRKFQLIYITGNAFQAFLNRTAQNAFLTSVKRHLAEAGLLAFETRNPSGHDLSTRLAEEHWLTYTSVEGFRVDVSGTQTYDAAHQILHWTTYRRWNDGRRDHTKITRIACRFTMPDELTARLHENHFQIMQQYGNWNKESLTGNSPSIITLCQHGL